MLATPSFVSQIAGLHGAAWGDAIPSATRERIARRCAGPLSVAGLIHARAAA